MADQIAGNQHTPLQRRRERKDSLTIAKRPRFLIELEASCNVRRACDAVGVGRGAAYNLRQRDPVFAAAWSAALDRGCENLRALLLARAMGTADPELIADNSGITDAPLPAEPMSDEMRLKVLQSCRAAVDGRVGRPGFRGTPAFTRTPEQVLASINTKLDRVEARLKRNGAL